MPEYPPLGQSLEVQGGLQDVNRIPYKPPVGLAEDPRILMGLITPNLMPNLSRLPFNFPAWQAAQAAFPESTNIEDRRYMTSPLNPFTNKAFATDPSAGMLTKEAFEDLRRRELDAICSGARLPKK